MGGSGVAGIDARPWYAANDIVAFLLELAALGFLAWWGFGAGHEGVLRILLGLGTPLLAAVVWGLFAAPRARWRPRLPLVLVVKALVLGGGAAALYGVGHPVAAGAVVVVTVANIAVAETFRPSAPAGTGSTAQAEAEKPHQVGSASST